MAVLRGVDQPAPLFDEEIHPCTRGRNGDRQRIGVADDVWCGYAIDYAQPGVPAALGPYRGPQGVAAYFQAVGENLEVPSWRASTRRRHRRYWTGGKPRVRLIRDLFRVEHDATEQKIVRSSAHLALRTARSKRLVEEFFQWAENKKAEVLPKSPPGEALGYAINQRARLELFLSDARIPIHNNGSEARLRVIALARHNYLFFGHPRAGRNFAGLYSLVGSCIANGVEPTDYLTNVLPRIRDAATDHQLDALLPDRWQPLGPAP